MKKIGKSALIGTSLLGLAFIIVVLASSIIYSPEYVYRCIINGESKVTDFQVFSSREIVKSNNPYHYKYNTNNHLGNLEIKYTAEGKEQKDFLEPMLIKNNTSSLLVIYKDTVVFEKYFNGYTNNSVQTSFSAVKSLDSLLIGVAIEEGYIRSELQPIVDFIPELKGQQGFEKITLKNLLMMRSPIYYQEGKAWFSDDAKTYYMPDLRDLALNHMRIDKNYSGQFHYNNYHPLILGIILERSTGKSVSAYFQEKIWDKVGAENDASWSLDSEKTGFEKMESGFNFRSIDFAKIGSMLLHEGKWNGETILNKEWINHSTIAPTILEQEDTDGEFLKNRKVGYQFMWYSIPNEEGGSDFFASGKYGQYLYVSPENDTVIVRTGINTGKVDWWPDVLQQIARSHKN